MIKRLLLTLSFAVLAFVFALGQPKYRLLDATDGLPDNEVKALFAAPDGRLGVRTSSSLALFDGCTFRSRAVPGGAGCKLSYVSGLPTAYVDSGVKVWLKETGRAVVFNLLTEQFEADVQGLFARKGAKGALADFFVDGEGDFWMVQGDGRLVYSSKGKSLTVNLPTKGLRDVCRQGGRAWLVYADGRLTEVDMKTMATVGRQRLWGVEAHQRDFVRFAQGGGRAWLMWPHGVAVYDSRSGQWRTVYADEQATLVSIGVTADGKACVGVRLKGMLTIAADGTVGRQTDFITLSGERVRDDVEAIESIGGNLFVGLYSRGLCLYNANMQGFPFHTFAEGGLSFTGSYQLADHADGKVVLAHSGGVALYDPSTATFSSILPSLSDGDFIRTFTDSRRRMWLGTFRHGFFLIDTESIHHYEQGEVASEDINYNVVRGFAEDSRGQIYASFHGGLGLFDEAKQRIVPLADRRLKPYKVINAFVFDRHDRLWVASSTGLYAYSVRDGKVLFPADVVADKAVAQELGGACKALCVDAKGTVWVGLLDGLIAIDPQKRTSQRFGKADGMPNEMVQGIVDDRCGGVWVTTAGGLCRFVARKGGGYVFTVFDGQNKLGDPKFLPGAVAHVGEGRLLLGCAKGYYEIDPKAVTAMLYEGRPLLTSVSVNNREVLAGQPFNGRVLLDSALHVTRRLTLAYNENFVTLRFSGLNFDMPRHTYYKYRLKGVDRDWVEISPQDGVGVAAYTDLSAGTYTFEVYSAGFDREWSARPATIEIVVTPAWWLTWWMKLLYVVAAVVLLAAFVWWRKEQKRRRREMEELRQRLEAYMGNTIAPAPAEPDTTAEQPHEPSDDELWLREVTACVERNLADSEYGVDQLARDMLLSRMGLYRKLKQLIGQTPAELIRTVRLRSAERLLKVGKLNVSEVAYQVGFASPQNFSKHFKEMFGVLPSQYNV